MSFSSNQRFVSEINVTPFVDVMLVLLIIFMVTAPMMTEGLEVKLPKTQAVSALPTDDNIVVLTLKASGELYLNEYATPIDTLAEQLQAAVVGQGKKLFLKADAGAQYGDVVDIMGRVAAAGIQDLGIVAERQEAPAQENDKKIRGRVR